MKIGIVTYWTSNDNYGQLLQCYALQQYLKKKGHSPFLIRYSPKDKVSFIYRVFRKIKNVLYGNNAFFQKEKELRVSNKKKNIKRKFSSFRENNIISSPQEYVDIKSLRKNPPQADVYISGSDQVWHNSLFEKNTKGWFLDFGTNHVKRISYAASVGREYDKKEIVLFKELLQKLDFISVREISSKQLCETLGFNATVTIDPTLLLQEEDYDKIVIDSSLEKVKDTIFLYVLNALTPEDIYWDKIKLFLQTEGKKLHPVFSSGYVQARELCSGYHSYLDTIPQWVATLRESDYVITNSFHGMVFAIIFHRPFIVIPLTEKYSGGNSRIFSLLSSLGIQDRIFNNQDILSKQMKRSIDWESVDKKLKALRLNSERFIEQSLAQ